MRNRLFLRALVAWLVAMASINACAQAAAVAEFDIPEQALESALRKIADTQNLQIIFTPSDVRGVSTRGVKGKFTAVEAVQKLLEGTGLVAVHNGSNAIAVKPMAGERSIPSGPARSSANPAQDQTASSDQRAVQLEGIVVTAQKRSELLIDVPQSVTVLTGDDLAKLGAVQFRDFANTVPGLNFMTAGPGYSQVSLRGVTVGRDIGPTVGIYVDEVPYGSSSAFANGSQLALDVGLFDMERIEVLRGPQGTLYGASTMGGLIKYVTRQPNAARFGVDAQAGISATRYGGTNSYVAGTVNAPIMADRAALRATGFFSRDGGFIDNLQLGQKNVNASDIYGGRVDLLLMPTGALSIRIVGSMQDISRDGEGTANFTVAGVPLDGELDQRRFIAEPFDQRFRILSGTVNYDFDRVRLTSISSFQTTRTAQVFDFSRLYVPLLALPTFGSRSYSAVGSENRNSTDKFTQEVRLAAEGNRQLEWLVGGFYTRETSGNTSVFQIRNLAGEPVTNDVFTFSTPSRYEEYAAFGDLTWHLSSKFDVTGGVRYARNIQNEDQIGSGLFGTSRPAARAADNVFTYLANARYHVGDHATAYLRYATGYRPGGPNFASVNPATGLPVTLAPFEADSLKSYEAGFKAETAERNLAFELAAYVIDWSNIQVSTVRNNIGLIANAAGGATIRGAELSFIARPTRGLAVTGAFAYQDAKMAKADPDLRAAKGERLPNVPRFTAALNADYELPLGSLRPTVGATLRYVDERKAGFGPTAYPLPDYTTVDLRAGLTFNSVKAQLYVHNLLDERGQLSAIISAARVLPVPAIMQPRTIGLTVTTQF